MDYYLKNKDKMSYYLKNKDKMNYCIKPEKDFFPKLKKGHCTIMERVINDASMRHCLMITSLCILFA